MKPVINIDELEFVEDGENTPGRHSPVASKIGAKKLGYNISICPPGKSTCPFHNHRINEEMFMILEGTGLLRFGDKEYALRQGDIIACPPGDASVAHEIINTGKVDLKYLSLATAINDEVCEYPDSGKVGIYVGEAGNRFRHLYHIDQDAKYYDGETNARLFK
ncbi:MAG: cupin domain-containing protein [Rhizobiales bacterium]|nr:cupin domain-containing protein [Hyphomicrobiales bacterium]NRB13589.1 cupin domain-containing protein [Hyphomicrobiales bacterium]